MRSWFYDSDTAIEIRFFIQNVNHLICKGTQKIALAELKDFDGPLGLFSFQFMNFPHGLPLIYLSASW